MKVAIITRHAVSNYGSLLQALATQEALRRMGHEAAVIDYIRADETGLQWEETLLKRKAAWHANPIKRMVYRLLRQGPSLAAQRRFRQERAKYLNLTTQYHTLEELKEQSPQADVYLTGSDQVWGPVACGELDEAYFLSFVPENARCVAYAASFGHTSMNEERRAFFTHYLARYHALGMREDSAAEMLASLGLQGRQVLDPTLLMDESAWSVWCAPRVIREDYVLVYQLGNDPALGEYAQRVAQEKGLRLVRLSASLHQLTRGGHFLWLAGAAQFLSLIRHASVLVTDSFHGTAFAVNFSTPFVDVLQESESNGRILSLLRLTGLEKRLLRDGSDTALAGETVDFAPAQAALKREREISLCWLREAIEGKEEQA